MNPNITSSHLDKPIYPNKEKTCKKQTFFQRPTSSYDAITPSHYNKYYKSKPPIQNSPPETHMLRTSEGTKMGANMISNHPNLLDLPFSPSISSSHELNIPKTYKYNKNATPQLTIVSNGPLSQDPEFRGAICQINNKHIDFLIVESNMMKKTRKILNKKPTKISTKTKKP